MKSANAQQTHSGIRYDWIDTVKGVGIILVVIGHINRGLMQSGILHSASDAPAQIFDTLLYSFHMPLFFVISGLLHKAPKDAETFRYILARLSSFAIPYFFWISVQSLVELAASSFTNSKASLETILMGFIIPRAQFWFIPTLLAYFIFCVLIGKTNRKTQILILSTVAVIAFAPINRYFQNFPFFVLGLLTGPAFLSSYSSIRNVLSLLLAFTVSLIAIFYFSIFLKPTTVAELCLTIIAGSTGSLLFITCSKMIEGRLRRFLTFIGQYSMHIFLIHIIICGGIRIILEKVLHVRDPYTHLIIAIPSTIALSIIVALFLQRTGFGWVFGPWGKRLTKPGTAT